MLIFNSKNNSSFALAANRRKWYNILGAGLGVSGLLLPSSLLSSGAGALLIRFSFCSHAKEMKSSRALFVTEIKIINLDFVPGVIKGL